MSLPRGAIVTAAGPTMRAVLRDQSLPSFRDYARKWGWSVCAHDLATDGTDLPAQQAKWAKIELLRTALQCFPTVLWLDADVLITRNDDDVTRHLRDDSFQALALEQVPAQHRVNPCTGVWLLRSCPESLAFLDVVQEAGQQPGPWADQGAVLTAMGWDRGDHDYRWAKPGTGSPFTAGTSWLPPSWNHAYDPGAARMTSAAPHAVHFTGMSAQARYDAMDRYRKGSARPVIPYPTRAHLGALLPAR